MAAALAALLVFWLPAPAGWPPGGLRAIAVIILTIGLLSTAVVDEYLTALIFFFLCVVLSIAPPNIVFSGFFSGSVWLVFGGVIIGQGMVATGLADRIAGSLEKHFAGSYFRLIAGTVMIMFLLAFLMPSSIGRVMIMLPVALALADRAGFEINSNGFAGLVLAIAVGTLTPTFAIMPASVPNLVLVGAAEAVHGIQISYGQYLLLHLPVLGLVSVLALPVFITLLFPAKLTAQPNTEATKPFAPGELRMLAVLITCLGLWATDTMHGIAPAWIALGGAIICALPVSGIIPKGPLLQKVNFGAVLFLAGIVGMGAVVAHTGIGALLGRELIEIMPLRSESGLATFASLVGLGTAVELVTTLPGQPAILTPLADAISQATGWPVLTVLMAQVPAWGLVFFPYQAPQLVATRAVSGLSIRHFIRLLVPFALFGWLVMVPLQYVWWRYLGYIP
jgi:di/tricarboxylate transporter